MEASQEDACSSGSSVSSRSSISSVTQISTIKYLHIPEKLELVQSLPVEMASDPRGITENTTSKCQDCISFGADMFHDMSHGQTHILATFKGKA